MELAPVPRRRPWSWGARTAFAVLVAAPVLLLVLVPAAFGLDRYVTAAPAGDVARGSVVLARAVPLGDLEDGDVVTVSRAGTAGLVTGSVVGAGGAGIEVRAGEDGVPIGDRTTVDRLVLAVPLVGYPFLGASTPRCWRWWRCWAGCRCAWCCSGSPGGSRCAATPRARTRGRRTGPGRAD
ncbi:hypothetical protein ENKNEFLB_03627 [Nocardioides aquaticus]|uniref:Peptidase S26 domain-containing protein n=1 Tax=Nocardioides aquaticus TaxID=160826 RepID=A0ABX8EL09_9ACTN|nr:hypothetical protein [Nocardioides aquaticus]QVT81219.1 hypothetical protein ENKNEFLB_03627 [Nocardioides aquaticus]